MAGKGSVSPDVVISSIRILMQWVALLAAKDSSAGVLRISRSLRGNTSHVKVNFEFLLVKAEVKGVWR